MIIVQFDNVHLKRDNPNVPSDIEQIPALHNFMKDNGTLLANDHTVLISHTADGIISTETGLYPDRFGGGVANTFPYLNPSSTQSHTSSSYTDVPGTSATSLFTYWTDPVGPGDTNYTLLDSLNTPSSSTAGPTGTNTPAPWVAFTRAGCDFAGVGSANMEFENDTSDLSNVFGASSPQYAFGNWSYNTAYDQYNDAGSNLGETDFEGLAVHCSLQESQTGGLCSSANGGEPDVLPDEPHGYTGYNALFGAVAINPVLTGKPDQPVPASYTPNGDTPPPAGNWIAPPIYDVFAPNATNTGPHPAPVANMDATTLPGPPQSYQPGTSSATQILDATGNAGFPGFDGMEANNALGYTAALQEAGVPVTYTYISDVHDDQYGANHGNAFGPGEAGYETQLREYNAAFSAFFNRLAADGINQNNSTFVFTVDEGDHYAGGPPLNPGCDGVNVPCQYDTAEAGTGTYGTPSFARNVGEIDANLPNLVKAENGITTAFGFDDDDAPAIIVPNQASPSGPRPGPNDPAVRALEQGIAGDIAYDPIDGHNDPIMVNLADETEEQILHMVNADPQREPTFTLFGNPNFYFEGQCTKVGYEQGQPGAYGTGPGCPVQDNAYAWNHGDIQPEIASTWQGWVGPGIAHLGETSSIWTDHTDVRQTLMTLLGLQDDYNSDGTTVAQILEPSALPWTINADRLGFEGLRAAYKQLNAPFGAFSLDTLQADTNAMSSNSPGDSTYTVMDAQLQACETARQALVGQIASVLQDAETGHAPVPLLQAIRLSARAVQLLHDASSLSSDTTPPTRTICS